MINDTTSFDIPNIIFKKKKKNLDTVNVILENIKKL